MGDTSQRAGERYHELLRAQAPYERLEQAISLSRAVRELAVAGILQRHPNAQECEIPRRLAVRLYGREMAMRMFGEIPQDAR